MNLSTKSKILIDADLSKRMALNRMEEDKNKLSWIVAVQQSLFSPITIRSINEINQRFSDLIRSRKLFETYASKLCSTRFAHCAPAKFDSSRKLLENKLFENCRKAWFEGAVFSLSATISLPLFSVRSRRR